MRSDSLDGLTAAGWAAVQAYSVRTIVDLRTPDERAPDVDGRPASLTTVPVPLADHTTDPDFWAWWRDTGLWATPLYFRAFLDRSPCGWRPRSPRSAQAAGTRRLSGRGSIRDRACCGRRR